MENLKKDHTQQVVTEIGIKTREQLANGGALLVIINRHVAGLFRYNDLQNDLGKLTLKPLTKVFEENPGSPVKIIIFDRYKKIASSYSGRTKSD